MTELIWKFNLFDKIQIIEINRNNNITKIKCSFDKITDTLSELANNESECKIYLTGLSEKHLEPFKETILSTMETKYSKNNVEVVII